MKIMTCYVSEILTIGGLDCFLQCIVIFRYFIQGSKRGKLFINQERSCHTQHRIPGGRRMRCATPLVRKKFRFCSVSEVKNDKIVELGTETVSGSALSGPSALCVHPRPSPSKIERNKSGNGSGHIGIFLLNIFY